MVTLIGKACPFLKIFFKDCLLIWKSKLSRDLWGLAVVLHADTSACDAELQYGWLCESPLPYFWFNSWLVASEGKRGWPEAVGPYIHIETRRSFWILPSDQLISGHFSFLGNKPADWRFLSLYFIPPHSPVYLFVSLTLSVTLSSKNRKRKWRGCGNW